MKKYFFRLPIVAVLVFSLFSSCKQGTNNNNQTKTEITVTITKDEHVEIAPESFKLEQGAVLGLSDLKAKMPTLKFAHGFELSKIHLNNKDGKEITETKRHTFNENTTIFITSKNKPNSNIAKLTELKIDGIDKTITDNIDAGKTSNKKVMVEYKVEPSDAEVSCTPNLESGYWNLGNELGTKHLNIIVKKGDEESRYFIAIELIKEGTPVIKKITVENQEKTGNDITSSMTFNETDKGRVLVKVELSNPSAKVAWNDGELKEEKEYNWILKQGKNSLKIVVGNTTTESTTYSINISSIVIPIPLVYTLNGTSMSQMKAFKAAVENGENPVFDAKSNFLNVTLKIVGEVDKVEINKEQVEWKKESGYYIVNKSINIGNETKQIDITITPTFEEARFSATNILKFQAKGNGTKETIKPVLSISSNANLPKEFLDNLTTSTPPLYKVFKSPAKIKIQISEYEHLFLCKQIKINDEVLSLKKDLLTYSGEKDILVTPDTPELIKIDFVAKNTELSETLKWQFNLQGGGVKPVPPGLKLYWINDNGSTEEPLPKYLLEHLQDETNPKYTFDGKKAKVIVGSGTKDLIAKIEFKMDGTSLYSMAPKDKGYQHLAEYTFDISDVNEHNIEIVFTPTDKETYRDSIFKFKLQASGRNPILPKGKMGVFSIRGTLKAQLPNSLTEHLTDGTEPEHIVAGKHGEIEVGTYDETVASLIEKVKFTVDSQNSSEIIMHEVDGIVKSHIAQYYYILPDINQNHLIKIEFIPKATTEYLPLVYTFRLKSDKTLDEMPLVCGYNGEPKDNGSTETLETEAVTILVQARRDILKDVTIGEKGKNEKKCNIIQFGSGDISFWNVEKTVALIGSDGLANEKTIIIKATPKDADAFAPFTCEYKLKGKKVSEDNAKFERNQNGAIVSSYVKYKTGLESDTINDYGAESLTLQAHTISPRATVKYQFVDMRGIALPGAEEKDMVKDSEGLPVHTAENITLFEDKPTRIKAYVIAENGNLDKTYGMWFRTYNPIALRWDYSKKQKGADFENEAYDVVEIERFQIENDKIYLAFAPWKKEAGYQVVSSSLPTYQGAFDETLDIFNKNRQWYKTTVNVADLTKTSNPVQELEVVLPLQKKVGTSFVDCFTYKVKIKLK